jgi:hypothetical protein
MKKEIKLEKENPIRIDLSQLDPGTNDISTEDLSLQEGLEQCTMLSDNSRCVPVGTFLNAPDGRKKKKEMFKGKSAVVKFRLSLYQKKLLKVKAKRSGTTISEFCRNAAFEKEIKERVSEDHITAYRTLTKYHNNFKSIGNMFRKKDPKLSAAVYALADEIKIHLKKLQQ